MPRQILVDLVGDSKKFTKATDEAIRSTGKLSGAFAKFKQQGGISQAILGGVGVGAGLGVFGAVTAGIGMVTDAIGNSISAASDQEEAMSKVNVVFGEQASVIQAWARTASTSMGMSETAALSAAGTLGNLFDALGIADDASAEMSQTVTQLAADLASFNNVPVAEAISALQSGLVGETEPMRRFGANISAARVEAYALAKGMAASKSAITDAMKVQARYELILQDTVNAQGDFARTSDGLANSQKTLDARINEAMTSIGAALIPVVSTFVTFASDVIPDVISGLGNLGDAFNNINRFIDPGVAAIQDFEEAVRAKAEAMGFDATETLAWVQAEERRAELERERARTTAAVLKIDEQMAEITANARKEIEGYNQAVEDGADAETMDNIIKERKLQLNSQLNPLLVEKNRLLGIEAEQQAAAAAASNTTTEAERRATAGLKAYTEAKARDARAASVLTGAWTGMGIVAGETGKAIYGGLVRPTRRAMRDMFKTAADAKGPWKKVMADLAHAGKDPFRPAAFENWMERRAAAFVRKARQRYRAGLGDNRAAAQALADVMTNPILRKLATTEEAIQSLVNAMAAVNGVRSTLGNFDRNGNGTQGRTGNNASGTSNWRGGWSWVGEQGPELMKLPGGTKIKSNRDSMGSGASHNYNINVNVAPGGDMVATGKAIVEAIRQYERRSGAVWRS
jgi:hypothetical protein